ncbi:hypothetical protein F1C16_04380 [Hymenobacter sp. NBH84]|uniref:hypothetical protein n=1 Tax=Hymenobacter sp. NBH84 TaxID=2596915 RepID=UPI00162AA229|nr:hypothetical protein [Hymenobacter sp. NBH84]QNE38843.1 hypothetical protein F1C16_04380 [Hymenobacter sp. NBH84]
MQVYREILPNSYLVILVESAPAATDAGLLRSALRQASRSGKEQVWLDCSGISFLPLDMLPILTRYGRMAAPPTYLPGCVSPAGHCCRY